jgi:hypothetical protein
MGREFSSEIRREDIGVNERRIKKWNLKKYGGSVPSDISWLMMTIEKGTFSCENNMLYS